jgi:hypothetical protein
MVASLYRVNYNCKTAHLSTKLIILSSPQPLLSAARLTARLSTWRGEQNRLVWMLGFKTYPDYLVKEQIGLSHNSYGENAQDL